jgi:glyceraldehyde 3-phosphate dehydrogenase
MKSIFSRHLALKCYHANLEAVEDTLGVVKGHLEPSMRERPKFVDNMHKKYRRGRAAALNMVITETGAGSAVAKALPSLEGKLTSNAIRVPCMVLWLF